MTGKDGQFGVASGQNILSGARAATEEGSYERASSKDTHADCEHDKAGRNPPSHPPRHAQHDHYETPYGQQERDDEPDNETRHAFGFARSFVGHPNSRGTDLATRPAPGMTAAVIRLAMRL